ncbi:uncharacterized protein [Apostichopus japonicus]|uniref:uncharacterized protein n=1 Tax=Stichopus japonicus TaxID=307972 RepID=UPI003AB306D8
MELQRKAPVHFLLSYCGELLQFELKSGKQLQEEISVLLTCSHFKISADRQRMHKLKTTSMRVQNPQSDAGSSKQPIVTIIKCKTIAMQPMGLCRPVVLLAFTHSLTNTWFTTCVYVPESARFATLGSFTCQGLYNIWEAYTDLLDGPAIICHYQSSIYLSIWNSRRNKFQCSQHSVTFTAPNSIRSVSRENLENFLILAVIPSQGDQEVSDLFGKGDSSLNDSDWLLLRINNEKTETHKGLIDQLPYAYAAVTEKVLMIGFRGDNDCDGSILLATCLAQLIFIRPDGSCHICDLPFGDVSSMYLSTVGECDSRVLISSKAKCFCVVDLKSLTIVKVWSGCVAAFSDDFLGVGSNQYLLLKDDGEIEGSNKFLLTDLVHSWPMHQLGLASGEDSGKEEFAHQSMQNAVNALELRLQSSSNFLQRLQLQSCQKEAVISRGQSTLDEVVSQSGRENQTDLICILGDDDDGTSSKVHNMSVDVDLIPLKMESFWKRIIGRNFICGVLVMNSGAKPISDICLLLVPTTSCAGSMPTINTHGKLQYPSEDSCTSTRTGGNDQSNSYLLKGQKTWITTATECPMFDSMAAFKFDVILVWKEWIIDGNQELSQERRKSLLNCSLSFDDLEKLTIEFSSRRIKSGEMTKIDFLALGCIQLHSPLRITTRCTALGKVPTILCNEFGFVHVTMDTNDGLFCDGGCLGGVGIVYRVDSQKMTLLVNTWDRHQLVLFLRNLFSILPSDSSVTVLNPAEDTKAKVQSLTLNHLHRELEEVKRMAKEKISQGTLEETFFKDDTSNESLMKLRLNSDSVMMKLAETISSKYETASSKYETASSKHETVSSK